MVAELGKPAGAGLGVRGRAPGNRLVLPARGSSALGRYLWPNLWRAELGGHRAGRFLLLCSSKVAFAATGLVVAVAGCGIGLNAASAESPTPHGDAGASFAPVDAGIALDASKVIGMPVTIDAGATGPTDTLANTTGKSPLCGAPSVCDPDKDEPCTGGGTGAADSGALGCHVTNARADAGPASACSAAGTGKAESECHTGAGCAPGFECVVDGTRTGVDGAATGGVCRHYCCDNTCGDHGFCDIETTLGAVVVPVCVARAGAEIADAGAMCQLLDDATCGASGLTCQVVNENTGQVACVTPGSATANESCETTHCAQGFSCIVGYFPNRECAQLCNHVDDCPTGQTCTPNAALANVNTQVGICTQTQ